MNRLLRLAEWAINQSSRAAKGLVPTKCPAALERDLAVTMAIVDRLLEREKRVSANACDEDPKALA